MTNSEGTRDQLTLNDARRDLDGILGLKDIESESRDVKQRRKFVYLVK